MSRAVTKLTLEELLDAVLESDTLTPTVASLAISLGRTPSEVERLAEPAKSRRYLESWDDEFGCRILMLTVVAIRRLGAVLPPRGDRWGLTAEGRSRLLCRKSEREASRTPPPAEPRPPEVRPKRPRRPQAQATSQAAPVVEVGGKAAKPPGDRPMAKPGPSRAKAQAMPAKAQMAFVFGDDPGPSLAATGFSPRRRRTRLIG